MTDRYEFAYVECDMPEGVTLREWRASHSSPRRSTWSRVKAWAHR